jgi:hypothetical protein
MSFWLNQAAISNKQVFPHFESKTRNYNNEFEMEPILSLSQLVRNLGNLVGQLDAPAQQQALVDAKKAIDTLTLALLNRHNFPLGPNWNIHE